MLAFPFILLRLLAYIGGLVWMLLLANDEYNAGTYVSENALLPGLVCRAREEM